MTGPLIRAVAPLRCCGRVRRQLARCRYGAGSYSWRCRGPGGPGHENGPPHCQAEDPVPFQGAAGRQQAAARRGPGSPAAQHAPRRPGQSALHGRSASPATRGSYPSRLPWPRQHHGAKEPVRTLRHAAIPTARSSAIMMKISSILIPMPPGAKLLRRGVGSAWGGKPKWSPFDLARFRSTWPGCSSFTANGGDAPRSTKELRPHLAAALETFERRFPPCCSGTRWRLARSRAEVTYCMAAPVLHHIPLPVGDQRLLLLVRGITVVSHEMSPGTAEVTPSMAASAGPGR